MSGKISGYVSCDGGAFAGVAGFITEDTFGMNHLNGFSSDFSGNNCGFIFTTVSGILPVVLNVVTQLNVSGRIFTGSGLTFIASGPNVVVPPATLSGVFGTIPIATISGNFSFIPSGILQIASGPFVVATASVASGSLYLASGSIFLETFAGSGVLGASGGLALSWGNSGMVKTVSGTTWTASGATVVTVLSTISGVNAVVPIATISGTNAVVPGDTLSGTVFLPSGSLFKNTYASGVMSIEFPYAFLKVDQSGITGEAQRSPLNALRKLNNAWNTTALSGFLTIYKENDSSTAFTQAITAVLAASGAPITGLDTQ